MKSAVIEIYTVLYRIQKELKFVTFYASSKFIKTQGKGRERAFYWLFLSQKYIKTPLSKFCWRDFLHCVCGKKN